MSGHHDPLCPAATHGLNCSCALVRTIRRAVAGEIAQAIEAAIVGEAPFDVQRDCAAIARRIGGTQ